MAFCTTSGGGGPAVCDSAAAISGSVISSLDFKYVTFSCSGLSFTCSFSRNSTAVMILSWRGRGAALASLKASLTWSSVSPSLCLR